MGIRDKRCTHPNRARRQESAKELIVSRNGRTVGEQLARLDRGGYRAVKERARLKAAV